MKLAHLSWNCPDVTGKESCPGPEMNTYAEYAGYPGRQVRFQDRHPVYAHPSSSG
jgi:hypothetical protein